jgi:hypothetical protein
VTVDDLDDLIVAALRHEPAPWPGDADTEFHSSFFDAAADHGVTALLSSAPAVSRWPDSVRSAIRDAARFEIATEEVRRRELADLLSTFAADGVRVLVLKGAHLAYSRYPHAWLRPRLDTDLLVAPGDRDKADCLLRRLKYQPGTGFGGELVTHQFQYRRANRYGLADIVDLHWKISNPHVFADAFSFDELHETSMAIEALGPDARGASPVHALMIACVHRAAHHGNTVCLIWLYDIHLLADALSVDDRARVAGLAAAKRLRSVCARGIADARALFATRVAADWLERLRLDGRGEPSAAFLNSGRTKADLLVSDLQALGWPQRARLIQEHLFPPAGYMRRAYGLSSSFFLPVAYVDRAVSGIGRWFRRDV